MNFRCATYGISGSILLLFSVSLFSQGYRVEGNVTDLETGHPISLATVYKSLETLVTCGLASKLTYSDGSARYDARMDPHHHARCVSCGSVMDVSGQLDEEDLRVLARPLDGFSVLGYRLELSGFCAACSPHQSKKDSAGPMN